MSIVINTKRTVIWKAKAINMTNASVTYWNYAETNTLLKVKIKWS